MRWIALIAAALLAACSDTAEAEPVGIYAYRPVEWNAEVAERFPIVFVQYESWNRNYRKVEQIKSLVAGGSRVIIDFQFLKSLDERAGRKPAASLETILADADWFLRHLHGVPFEAITLDEEVLPVHIPRLVTLYSALKERYPERLFLQWVATHDVAPLKGVPADGWVFDPYLMPQRDYAAFVASMRRLSDRLYSVVWAAPNWQIDGGFRKEAHPSWWNDGHWRVLYNRLAVNQANDVPTIFYLIGLEGKEPVPLWTGNACSQSFFKNFSTVLLPYLEKHRLPLATPAEKPHWMPDYC